MGSSGVGSGNLHSVFVYGSLLADDVVRVLLKRVPESSSAVLNNYHRFSIKGRVYPAILPLLNKTVTGKVLLGITDPELHILDVFEDVEYQRTTVDVSFMDNADKLQAQAYVWADKNDPNLYGDWDFQVISYSYCVLAPHTVQLTRKRLSTCSLLAYIIISTYTTIHESNSLNLCWELGDS
ncbi:hypothetical protein Dsin_017667 [Dipteronia sinensis]|uniref:Putative gamma-glutamylcyclotransferase n=1 Tax=Dipteronia sinensis TaxID=43782 RepID=A0AAE0E6M9_9ROSI|nr:hypothetical protein Dsin_017667 [Dipteronia sinensis]